MASNYTQLHSVDDRHGQRSQNDSMQHGNCRDQLEAAAHTGAKLPFTTPKCGNSTNVATLSSHRNTLNDAYIINNRRINFNQRAKKQLELLCEHKVSKYKLEEVHYSLPSSIKSTFIMTFSPDGQRVASTHGDHRIYICDLNTGKLLDTLEGHPKTPWCLAWHPSNRGILASGCLAGEVRVWDLKSKRCESWTSENNTIISSLDFHPKERVLVIATANDIHFWDWSESEPFAKTTTTHDREKVKFVVFDSSGTKLITGISNLPKYAGYSSETLQSRIIDGYLSQGSIDPIPTENMTQNSEINTSPVTATTNSTLNTHENFNEHYGNHSVLDRHLSTSANSNLSDQNLNSLSTTLPRVAHLYRQLESLEDSMMHISFPPYVNPRPVELIANNPEAVDSSYQSQVEEQPPSRLDCSPPDGTTNSSNRSTTDQERGANVSETNRGMQSRTLRNTFEPDLVAFDEFLRQLQLPPLVVDGQTINLSTIMEQHPIGISNQLYHEMQIEGIDRVNFIRISKLMSSARLYRQVVQQILSSNSGSGHYQPNQILTAQSVCPRGARNVSNLPTVHRNQSVLDPGGDSIRMSRSTDPIQAIQYRNMARNVPLASVCRVELLYARALVIMRSQQLVEQALTNSMRTTAAATTTTPTSSLTTAASSMTNNQGSTIDSSNNEQSPRSSKNAWNSASPAGSFYQLLNQVYSSLTTINHAPLTTSNVYTHITSIRVLIEKLLKTLSSLLHTSADGERLTSLIHNIADSLTSRRWTIPLGATLDEIRLDVIHSLCIVDLTMHFARQIQLLQIQRISFLSRIEESRRPTSLVQEVTITPSSSHTVGESTASSSKASPCTVRETDHCTSSNPEAKRKDSDEAVHNDEKRRKVENSDNSQGASGRASTYSLDAEMIDGSPRPTAIAPLISSPGSSNNQHSLPMNSLPHISAESMPPERLLFWNNSPSQFDQSLQRFLVATASSMSSNHILVRIYHRMHGNSALSLQASNTLDNLHQTHGPPIVEFSRRRALSQDHSSNMPDLTDASSASPTTASGSARGRVRPPAALHVNFVPNGSNYGTGSGSSSGGVGGVGGGLALETWPRHPHLHVYQTRGAGQHLWFNQWTIPLPMNHSNYRLQCWNFSLSTIPNIKDPQANIVTHKCRIHNDSSIDVSSDGCLVACLVPRDDTMTCMPSFDLRIYSLRSHDFGVCYYKLSHGSNAISVSLSPSCNYAVVGLASHKFINNDPNEDDLTIAKVFKLNGRDSFCLVRDIKVKRDDSSLSLNAIKWMSRGIVYNVGPQHHQRYQAARMRNVVAS